MKVILPVDIFYGNIIEYKSIFQIRIQLGIKP